MSAATKEITPGNIKLLSFEEFEAKEEQSIKSLMEVTELTHNQAELLLIASNWNDEMVLGEFYEDPDKVCKKSGIVLNIPERSSDLVKPSAKVECPICCSKFSAKTFISLDCGNYACKNCVKEHVLQRLASSEPPPSCLFSSCSHLLGTDVIKAVLPELSAKKAKKLITVKHIRTNRRFRQCGNCDCVAQLFYGEPPVNVLCRCGNCYCWNCSASDHIPITCDQIKIWMEKGADPAGKLSMMWIKANTKKCPQCQKDIQKNEGCNHMTCKCCGNEFCWLCRGPWKEHGSHSGGYYSCNKYSKSTAKELDDKMSSERETLSRYEHFFERYLNYEKDLKASEKRRDLGKRKMEEFVKEGAENPSSKRYGMNPQFISDGVELELKCRHLLMYSYIISYFMPDEDETNKEFFTFRQANLEGITERLAELNTKVLSDLNDDDLRSNIRYTQKFYDIMKETMKEAAQQIASQESKASKETKTTTTSAKSTTPSSSTTTSSKAKKQRNK